MNPAAYLIVIALIASASYFGIKWLVSAYSRYRGTQIVTCPQTGRPAVVEVDALHASLTSTVGLPDVRLKNCWRWPMNEECGQECLTDLDVEPGQCLVSGVLMRWYRGKTCCYCSKPFEEFHWIDHKPALRSLEGSLVLWRGVSVENISMVLETHLAVCWNCYIAQSFRLNHPEMVVYRPLWNGIPGGADSLSAPRHHHL